MRSAAGAARSDVTLIGINAHYRAARLMTSQLVNVINFTLYQSSRDSHYWSALGGLKDDVFIYDKCGRLAYYIPFPRSYIPLKFVELSIQSALENNP
jgi:hypothetical protein